MSVPTLRKALKAKSPGLRFETKFWDAGYQVVAGVDEVGRGAWAGPLTIGAVIAPRDRRIYKVRDSKMLTEAEREAMFDRIIDWCEGWSVGHASHIECDELGMSAAQKLATVRALEGLALSVDAVLVDGSWDFVETLPTETIVKGDQKSLSIAAASILAKVTRDRMLRASASTYPMFDFDRNKGYPCPRHRAALQAFGPTKFHRQSWAFVDDVPFTGVKRKQPPSRQPTLFD
ncbi:MAG: ribonuclease HII [Acidimicrobiales bacterium]